MRKRKRDQLEFWELELLHEIQGMFRALEVSYERLADTSGIDKDLIRFDGFDGNDPYESRFNRYSGFVNSHGRRMPFYKRLLERWKVSNDREHLTREDILRIIE